MRLFALFGLWLRKAIKAPERKLALMMYIEHTTLEDNLHYILKRVPSSDSPSGAEATPRVEAAAAASSSPARALEETREDNTAYSAQPISNGICNKPPSTNHKIHWSRRSEPNLISLNTKSAGSQESSAQLERTSVKLEEFVKNLKRTTSEYLDTNQKQELLYSTRLDLQSAGDCPSNNNRISRSRASSYFDNIRHPSRNYEDQENFEHDIPYVPKFKKQSLQPEQTHYQRQESTTDVRIYLYKESQDNHEIFFLHF